MVGVASAQIEQFREQGFTSVDALIDPDTVESLRCAYDEVIRKDVNGGQHDRRLGGLTRQVMLPRLIHRAIRNSEVFAKAAALASELLGEDVEHRFDMMIFKPAGHPTPTPWHQDLAYSRRPFAAPGTPATLETVQVWVALDDADVSTGCMQFLPGLHVEPLLKHYVFSGDADDDGRLLAFTDEVLDQLDLSTAVPCPVPAGGATAHGECTPHFTGINSTLDRDRRAYILNFRKAGHAPMTEQAGGVSWR